MLKEKGTYERYVGWKQFGIEVKLNRIRARGELLFKKTEGKALSPPLIFAVNFCWCLIAMEGCADCSVQADSRHKFPGIIILHFTAK